MPAAVRVRAVQQLETSTRPQNASNSGTRQAAVSELARSLRPLYIFRKSCSRKARQPSPQSCKSSLLPERAVSNASDGDARCPSTTRSSTPSKIVMKRKIRRTTRNKKGRSTPIKHIKCANCGDTEAVLKACQRCKKVAYCGGALPARRLALPQARVLPASKTRKRRNLQQLPKPPKKTTPAKVESSDDDDDEPLTWYKHRETKLPDSNVHACQAALDAVRGELEQEGLGRKCGTPRAPGRSATSCRRCASALKLWSSAFQTGILARESFPSTE